MPNRYCRAFSHRFPFRDGADLVYSVVSKEPVEIPTETAKLVQGCNQFRTLAEHASLLRSGSRQSKAHILRELTRCAEQALLLGDEQFLAHCRRVADEQSSAPPIATLGATTRNRPGLLGRGLASFIESAAQFGRDHDYVVIDDGRTPEEQTPTRDVLTPLSQGQTTIRYAGRDERRAFADALSAEAGVEPEVTRFALLGDAASPITTGAARNSLLLDTVGDLYLLVDDDSVCRVAPCPDQAPGVALDARTNPTELWFYRDRETMLRNAAFVEQDPLALHESILGRQLAACLPAVPQASQLDLTHASADFAQRIWSHPGRVMATSAGVVGDSGMGSTAYLAVPPDSQARLVGSEQDYVAAVENRQILRTPLRTSITRGTFCVGASLGLDNRALLPPFVPVQRNSDGLFSRTLMRCFRDGYKGYLPWAVLHDPLPPRSQSLKEAEADTTRVRLTHILRALILPSGFVQSGDAGRNMRQLGEEIIAIASQQPQDFQYTIRPRLVKSAAQYIEGIQHATSHGSGVEFYLRRQTAHWRRLAEALTTDEYFLPRDMGEGAAEIQRNTQKVVLQFGRLLRDWTAIVAAAKKLRARGLRLARPVKAA